LSIFFTCSVLSEKGWIVIPNEIRKKYGLTRGKRVNIVDYGGVISIIPTAKDAIRESEGLFKGGQSLTKALITERKTKSLESSTNYILDSYAVLANFQKFI